MNGGGAETGLTGAWGDDYNLSFLSCGEMEIPLPHPVPADTINGASAIGLHTLDSVLLGGGIMPERGLRGGGDNWGSLGDLVFCFSCSVILRIIAS